MSKTTKSPGEEIVKDMCVGRVFGSKGVLGSRPINLLETEQPHLSGPN